MWRAKKGKNKDDPFFEHTILLEPSVGRYIDHVLRSKHGCLILNPASHLKLHDNLEGGYLLVYQPDFPQPRSLVHHKLRIT
jgi:hypothetical protein